MTDKAKEIWASGEAYEQYVGRWSRKVAREFLAWIEISPGQTWRDVGCGAGALVNAILAGYEPKTIMAIDALERNQRVASLVNKILKGANLRLDCGVADKV